MSSTPIRFGTDGWRAIVGDQFTFENVARVAAATADWVLEQGGAPRVVIGFDTRFEGEAFAVHAAHVMADRGVEVVLSDGFVPTPAVSWYTASVGATAGVVITASHNPPEWNGFKIKASFGGPATPDQVARVEERLSGSDPVPERTATREGHPKIERVDMGSAYVEMLRERIDCEAIRSAGLRIAHDAMYGAGQGFFAALLGADSVVPLRSEVNPGFSGAAPEPIERNLEQLPAAVTGHGCAAGIANDGDADRIGMVDEQGRFVDSHRLLAILLQYLHEVRGMTGSVVQTFSTTDLLGRMADAFGLDHHTTPIGFKYICEHFVAGDVLVGGEESGGIAVKGHLPERDGIYIGLLVLEMLARTGQTLSDTVEALLDRFGRQGYWRVDVHTTETLKQRALDRLVRDGGLESVADDPVRRVETMDGYKHRTDHGWALVRASGTEPVLRIYAEAAEQATARRYVEAVVTDLGL